MAGGLVSSVVCLGEDRTAEIQAGRVITLSGPWSVLYAGDEGPLFGPRAKHCVTGAPTPDTEPAVSIRDTDNRFRRTASR